MTPSDLAVAALRKSREQFQFYADQHLAKTPPQSEKAQVNIALVAEINAVLLSLAEEEGVRAPDTLAERPVTAAAARIVEYAGTLRGRDGDDWTMVHMTIGELRAWTGVDDG